MGIILYDSIVCVCGEGSGRAEYVSRGERNESCLWKERGNENKCPPLVPHLLYDHYSGLCTSRTTLSFFCKKKDTR